MRKESDKRRANHEQNCRSFDQITSRKTLNLFSLKSETGNYLYTRINKQSSLSSHLAGSAVALSDNNNAFRFQLEPIVRENDVF